MSYSIKNYLKDKQGTTVSIGDIETFADEINKKSQNVYTVKSAQNFVSRYIDVQNNSLVVNINKRDPKQTFALLSTIVSSFPPELVPTVALKNTTYCFPQEAYTKTTVCSFLGPYNKDTLYAPNQYDDCLTDKEQKLSEIVEKLTKVEYPAQRSEKWFELREQMITASDGGTVVGLNPYEKPHDFIMKKVFGKPFVTGQDCYHGKKYEAIATKLYETRMNVRMEEFGLCQHPVYKFLGASPDGIVGKYKANGKNLTAYVGRMLEIKCPMRRKINMNETDIEVYGVKGEKITNLKYDVKKGVCPTYYWVQVQLQLQCCELDECDFLQTEIQEYDTYKEFLEDTHPTQPWVSQTTNCEKGAVIQLMPTNKAECLDEDIWNLAEFIYPPRLDMTPFEINMWISETVSNLQSTHEGKVLNRVLYWRVNQTRNLTIKRDDAWFAKNLATFDKTWKTVEYLKKNQDVATKFKELCSSKTFDGKGQSSIDNIMTQLKIDK